MLTSILWLALSLIVESTTCPCNFLPESQLVEMEQMPVGLANLYLEELVMGQAFGIFVYRIEAEVSPEILTFKTCLDSTTRTLPAIDNSSAFVTGEGLVVTVNEANRVIVVVQKPYEVTEIGYTFVFPESEESSPVNRIQGPVKVCPNTSPPVSAPTCVCPVANCPVVNCSQPSPASGESDSHGSSSSSKSLLGLLGLIGLVGVVPFVIIVVIIIVVICSRRERETNPVVSSQLPYVSTEIIFPTTSLYS